MRNKFKILATSLLFSSISLNAMEIKIEKKEEDVKFGVLSSDKNLISDIQNNFEFVKKISFDNFENDTVFKIEELKDKYILKNYENSVYIDKNSDSYNNISNYIYKSLKNEDSFFNEYIVFVKKYKDQYELVMSDFDGRNMKTILVSPEPILSPDLSSNKKFVTYVSFEKIRPAIYIHDLKTNKRKVISNYKGVNAYPKITKDDKSILISTSKNGSADIYSYDIEKNELKSIIKDSGNDISPESIKENKILFASDKYGYPIVYSLDYKTREVKKFFKSKKFVMSPSYSRKNTIAVYQEKGFYGILLKNNNTDQETSLVRDFFIESPSISKNGELIVYSTKENNKSILVFLNSNGEQLYTLKFNDSDIIEPSF